MSKTQEEYEDDILFRAYALRQRADEYDQPISLAEAIEIVKIEVLRDICGILRVK